MRAAHLFLLPALVAVSSPALAREVALDIPSGRLEDSVLELARQTGTSIVIADRDLARKKVGPLRGNLTVGEALTLLGRQVGAAPLRLGNNGWRLVRAPKPALARAERRPPPPPARVARPKPPMEEAEAEPIIVLGSKRDVSLEDYAGFITQIDGGDLAFGGVGGTDRVAARVTAVSTTHLGSGRNKLFIRGIADSSFTGPTQSTVGQYLGDLRLSYNAPDPDLRLSDIATVEVLEGPQGTLYGSGSLGGIVRIVPNAPDLDDITASATIGGSLTAHGNPGGDIGAVLNVPLVADRVALRLVADGEIQGGYIDKPLLDRDDVNRTRIGSLRGALRFDIDPVWKVDLIGVAQLTRGDDSQYADRAGPPLDRSASVTEGYRADYDQGQIVVSGRLGDIQLRSSTGIAHQHLVERYDATIPGGSDRLFIQQNRTRMIANETRLWAPLGQHSGWILGTSYTRNRARLTRELGLVGLPMPVTGVTNRTEEFTLYGEASVRLAQGLTGTLGGRFTSTDVAGAGEDVMASVAVAGRAITAGRREQMFLPSAAISAEPIDGMTVYLRYQEGFRPGGLAVEGDFVRRFRNDHMSTYEFGIRHGRPGAGPFDIAASASYADWRNIQADYIDLTGQPTTANVGDGQIWTLSLSGGFVATPGLRLDAGVIYNHSQITQPNLYAALIGPALAPITQIPNVAAWSARFGFDYRQEFGSGIDMRLLGWARYVGRSRLGVGPELGDFQGNYLDSGITLRIGRGGLGATLGITNLTDSVGNRFALGTPFAIGREQITPLRPFTVRLGLDAAF